MTSLIVRKQFSESRLAKARDARTTAEQMFETRVADIAKERGISKSEAYAYADADKIAKRAYGYVQHFTDIELAETKTLCKLSNQL